MAFAIGMLAGAAILLICRLAFGSVTFLSEVANKAISQLLEQR